MDVVTSRTIVHPTDLERSLDFYGRALDLPVVREFGAGAGRGVVFAAGGGQIEVVAGSRDAGTHGDPAPFRGGGTLAGLALWLQVRSVAEAVAEVAARGVAVLRPPVEEPWGLVEAWIEDPDGLRIHLVEVPADHPLRRDVRGTPDGPAARP